MGDTHAADGADSFAQLRYETAGSSFGKVRCGALKDTFVRLGDNSGISDKVLGDGENPAGTHPDGCINGSVFGTYIHGLFDTGELTERLASYLMKKKGITADAVSVESRNSYKERQYARLAGIVRGSLDMEAVYRALR
jgi:cobyric acid synthase